MDSLNWLQKHLRNPESGSPDAKPSDKILQFPDGAAVNPRAEGRSELDLVHRAADVFRSIEQRAGEFERHVRDIAEEAIERLQIAEKHIQDLEAKQRAAEAYIAQAHIKLREAGEALTKERARVAALENKIPQLETRARTAEACALQRENVLARIEDAIRTEIFRQGPAPAVKPSAAA